MQKPYIPGAIRTAELANIRAELVLAELEQARTAYGANPYSSELYDTYRDRMIAAVVAVGEAGWTTQGDR